jgi:F0F1-type ATP synthase membrane subunit b/b'
MNEQITTPLSQDEAACLLIAAQGQSMLAVGRWKHPIKSLVMRGLMRSNDEFNNVITDAGRAAIDAHEDEADKHLVEVANAIVGAKVAQADIAKFAEQAAQLLAQAARASAAVTGDSLKAAAGKWLDVIRKRTVELLDGGK